ncbi:MAG: bifunctional adenosylcobinamide kinase/adenosylcobinamide-phosphate guanylyltransferase [Tannerellaceae bacterium]|jgi:adenosylcobinamide kinase/adenosylcobinamide-phosphate guanylyltransferase|nr:bifunctional adenosylcobinamide kinase/adenosylcobinamide-phosphate guanylyltransferase [Tannerellaceae bacterium]
MKKRIMLITGGQRSGKSSYAQQLALQQTAHPVYLATSRIWDDEHRQRIERHQKDRGPGWTNIEEDKCLSRHPLRGRVVVVDCVTLWATNFFYDTDGDTEKALSQIKTEFDSLTDQEACFIFVSNEIGMGGMPAHELQRKFTDMQGWLNQYIASRADEVILMISGIPLTIKP